MENCILQPQRLFNQSLVLLRDEAELIAQDVRMHGLGKVTLESALASLGDDVEAKPSVGYTIVEGVAIIQIEGVLVQKLGLLRPFWGLTGYDGIRQNILMAVADPDVRAIVLLINSPGGVVHGCFDLVDTIYECRGDKPIWAILNENAYSGGYALACACDKIIVPRTGGTGSIGVIAMHVDWSKALDQFGLKVTFIQRGARKADGAPELPLSEEALERFQKDIDATGVLFEETVARNRKMAAGKVRDLEAATFQGAEGVKLGLADAVMAPDAAFRSLLEEIA